MPTLTYSGAKVSSWTLENGIKAHYFKHTYPEKRVELRVVVHAGSAYELPEEKGMAHFVEHMVFNGTESFPAGEVMKQMQLLGGMLGSDVNAYTTHDATVYHLQVENKKEDVELAMKMLSEFVGKPTFTKEEVEKEKPVVLAEKRERTGLGSFINEMLMRLLFAGTSYADPVVGTQETVSAFTPEMLRTFWKKWYRPDRMEVIIVGDVEKQDAQQWVEKYFASFAKADIPFPALPQSADVVPTWQVDSYKDATSTQMRLIWKMPPDRGDTVERLITSHTEDMLAYILSMRIERMVDEHRYIFEKGSAFINHRLTLHNKGLFITLSIHRGKEEEAMALLRTVLAQIRTQPIEQKEYAFVLNTYRKNTEQSIKNASSSFISTIQDSFVDSIVYGTPVQDIVEEYTYSLSILDYLRVFDLNERKAAMFDAQKAFALWVTTDKESLRIDELKNRFFSEEIAVPPYTFVEPEIKVMQLPPAPEVVEVKDYAQYEAKEMLLGNGVHIMAKHTEFDKDTFMIRAEVQGGPYTHAERETAVFQRLLKYATIPGMSRVQLTNVLTNKGIMLMVMPGNSSMQITMQGPMQEKEVMLQVLYTLLTQPVYDDEDLEKVKDDLRQEEEKATKDMRMAVNSALEQLLWPGEKTRALWLEAERGQLSLEKIRKIQKDILRAPHMNVTLVGSLPEEEMRMLAGRFFTTMPKQDAYPFSKEEYERAFPLGTKEVTIHVGSEQKAGVHLRFPAVPVDDIKAQAVAMLLTQLMDTAMNDRIREELGEVYTANVFQWMSPVDKKATYYGFSFVVDPTHVQHVEKAVWSLIEERKKKGFSAQELLRARMPMTTQIAMAKKMNMFWLSVFMSNYTGYPKDLMFQLIEELPKVTEEDIRKALQTSFQKDQYSKVINLPKV